MIAGQNELDDLSNDYEGLIGQDIYFNTSETTSKILYEISNGGHSSAELPIANIGNKTLDWAQYLIMGDESYCDSLIVSPIDASQYLTTLQCGESFSYDLNDDGTIDNVDLVLLVITVLNNSDNGFDINSDQNTDIHDILIFSELINDL